MLNRKLVIIGMLAAASAAFAALAEEASKADAAKTEAPKPALPSMDELLGAWGLSLSGYLDASYMHANRTPADRVFDNEQNSFALDQAAITIAKQPKEGFGALVNVIAGRDAKVIHSSGLGTTEQVDLTQAYLQYATGPFTVIGGKFTTLAGAEVIAPTGNTQYSRSLLFGAEPFTHTGIRGTYAPLDTLSLIVGVNNGWDQADDLNKQKTLELGASYTPIKGLTLNAYDYYGNELACNTLNPTPCTPTPQNGKRNLFDFVGSYSPIDPLSFNLEYLYVSQDGFISLVDASTIKAKYQGIAAYVNYMIAEQWRISLRGEYFKDTDGFKFGVPDNKVKEATLTLAYLPTKSIELRAEMRADKVSNPTDTGIFMGSDGTLSKSLFTYAMQAIYKF